MRIAILAAIVLVLLGPLAFFLSLVLRQEVRSLRRRIDMLEQRLAERAARPVAAEPATVEPVAVAPRSERVSTPSRSSVTRRDLESILGGQWLTWLGILAIFFGTAFFLAADLGSHPLAGVGQLLVGLLVGAGFILAGRTIGPRMGRPLAQGLLGGGIALLFLAAHASYAFHHLVPAAVVYPFLLGVAAIGALVALAEDSRMVATLTQTGALLAPFFLSRRGEDPKPFMVYLVAVAVGNTLLTQKRRWPFVYLTGFLGTAVLVVWWWAWAYSPHARSATTLGLTALWLLFAVPPLAWPGAQRPGGTVRALVVAANGLLYAAALYRLLDPEFVSLRGVTIAALSLAYVAAAFLAARRARSRAEVPAEPVRVTHYTGLALAALAVPIQFDVEWVTLSWTLLALVLVQSGLHRSGLWERFLGWCVLLLAVLRAVVVDVIATLEEAGTGYRPLVNGEFLVGIATAAGLGVAAWMVSRHRKQLTGIEQRLVTPLILMAASVLLWRVSFEIVAWFGSREAASGTSFHRPLLLTLSLVWAVYAGALILFGFLRRYRPIRFLGIGVLVLLILKVFFFDIQELERGYRIASFVGVGILLLLISLFYQRERKAG